MRTIGRQALKLDVICTAEMFSGWGGRGGGSEDGSLEIDKQT